MINLLPESYKTEIRAARANVILVRYIIILAVAAAVLGGIVIAAYVVLDTRKASAQVLLDASNTRTARYDSVRTEADALRTSLSNAKSILDQKVSYSKLIYEIADSMPEGTALDSLDLDSATFNSNMTIVVGAASVEAASQLESKFASNSETFSEVDLLSFESGSADIGDGAYPVKATLSFKINVAALQ